MTRVNETEPNLQQIFRYARLAANYNQSRSSKIAAELRKIEQELGMTAEAIMDQAMRKTDVIAKQSQ